MTSPSYLAMAFQATFIRTVEVGRSVVHGLYQQDGTVRVTCWYHDCPGLMKVSLQGIFSRWSSYEEIKSRRNGYAVLQHRTNGHLSYDNIWTLQQSGFGRGARWPTYDPLLFIFVASYFHLPWDGTGRFPSWGHFRSDLIVVNQTMTSYWNSRAFQARTKMGIVDIKGMCGILGNVRDLDDSS